MNKLFQDNIEACDAYKLLRDHHSRKECKAFTESLWLEYEEFADSDFLKEVQDEMKFTSRMWEMYTGCTFLRNGFHLEKKGRKGPDLKVLKNEEFFWVEATAPNKGTGEDAVPEFPRSSEPTIHTPPEEQIILRIASAIEKKYSKYQEYLSKGIISPTDPYGIAINSSDAYMFDAVDQSRIIKALFGLGYEQLIIDLETREVQDTKWSQRTSITKKVGSPVPLAYFTNNSYEGISFIIYSTDNILRIPTNQIGEELIFIHNPFAQNPIPHNIINFGKELIPDHKEGEMITKNHSISE